MPGLLLMAATLTGCLVVTVGLLGTLGQLPRNGWLGLPTAFRLGSDELWVRAHRRGGPVLLFGGVAVVMAGLAFGPFVLIGSVAGTVVVAVVLAQCALLAGSVGVAAAVGSARARKSP